MSGGAPPQISAFEDHGVHRGDIGWTPWRGSAALLVGLVQGSTKVSVMSIPSVAEMTGHGKPATDVTITEGVVRELLESQFPHLSHLELELAASGWDNVTYRLGTDLAVRLPRIAVAVALLVKEQRFLPLLTEQLDIALPKPLHVGVASPLFPRTFSIMPWLPGTDCSRVHLMSSEAARLGHVVRQLHGASLPGLEPLEWRGGPLRDRANDVDGCIRQLRRLNALPSTVLDQARAEFDRAASVARDTPSVPVHADLHPKNIIANEGQMAAIIDWGDLNLGDPANDLASVWMHFDPAGHSEFWSAYGSVSESTCARARGWALFFGLNLFAAEACGEQDFGGAGLRTLRRLLS